MRNHFIYNGKDCMAYGVYISGSGVFDAPRRSYEKIVIPGRNGELSIDNGRYENISLRYPAFAHENFFESMAGLKAALLADPGYHRLEDSYYPEEYRMALFEGGMTVTPAQNLKAGEFEIEFYCDPRRFLKSGDLAQTIADGGHIENPTAFPSKPLIRVTGYGEMYVGGDKITISQHFAYVDIDCEMMDCFHESDNANGYVSFLSNDFPVLGPGRTNITHDPTITKIEVTPHWWRI